MNSRIVAFFIFLQIVNSASQPTPILGNCHQLIIVLTSSMHSVDGMLWCFERSDSEWSAVYVSIPVVVGRNGLAWGRGENKAIPAGKPVKKEGDGCSPAGVFRLCYAVGLDPKNERSNLKIPYQMLTDSMWFIDDPNSIYYNEMVNVDTVARPDWQSGVRLARFKTQFRLGIYVGHNLDKKRGAGSGIFLHIWKSPDRGTVGCTAMHEKDMRKILHWIDTQKSPLLIQMPVQEYHRYEQEENVPRIRETMSKDDPL
jgi:D-alanyl-D-alanine dipeptidase